MDYAEGREFWDPALPELTKDERGAVYDEMNRGLAAIHGGDSSPWGCLISVAPRGISSGSFRIGPNSSAPVRLMSLSRWTDWPKGWVMQRAMRRDWHLLGLAGLETQALGIPSEAAYCIRRGLDQVEHREFAKVFAFFRFAASVRALKKCALGGSAASPDALKVGAMARPLAELGARLIG